MRAGFTRVSQMTATASAAAQAFRQLLQEQARLGRARDAAAVLPRLAELSPQLSVGDAIALGFWKAAADRSGAIELATAHPAAPRGLLALALSPAARHVALVWAFAAGGLRLWIDGQEQHPPRSADGEALATEPGWWCTERFYALHVAIEPQAPQDWQALPGSGRQQALWLWDTHQGCALCVEPGPGERWPAPCLRVSGAHEIQVLADRSAPGAAPVRTLAVQGWLRKGSDPMP